ncbi:hypothetical protein [Flindersiella endophytica]
MPTPILAAALCCGVVAGAAAAWRRIGMLRDVDGHPLSRLTHQLAGRALLPPATAAGSIVVLAAFDAPYPWLVPPVSALTVLVLGVLLRRLIGLAREVARAREELVGLLAYGAAICAWTWLLTPNTPATATRAAAATLACLVAVEWVFARPLDLAVRCREIASTGLVPVLLSDPAWRIDHVDVLPDRDSICVHYAGSAGTSLWVDLVRKGAVDAVHTEQVAPGLWRVSATATVCYLAIVADQVVRLEFDRGRRSDAEAMQVASGMRPVSARELARREQDEGRDGR